MISENGQARGAVRQKSPLRTWLYLLLVVAVCFVAHYKSLSCFFLADDLLCLDYLYKIFHGEPLLALQRLLAPWQDPSISLLYRPVCDLYFFWDYFLSKSNPFGYHLTNLLLHVCCSLLVYYNVALLHQIIFKNENGLTAILSALMFASSPLHVEPVVWLVGRADLSASMFLLLSLALAMRSFSAGKKIAVLSLVSYSFALLSKESAACHPAIIFAFCLLSYNKQLDVKNAFLRTLPFAILTALYLVLRFSILGTFLGGYTGSFGEALVQDWWKNLLDWNQLALLGLGTNLSLFQSGSLEVILLHLLYFIAGLVLLLRIPFKPWDSASLKMIAFLLLASLFALLPALQVAEVSGTLSNERVFYLASAFFFPLIVEALLADESFLAEKRSVLFLSSALSLAVLLGFTSVFCAISIRSYLPWQEASAILLNLQKAGISALKTIPQNKKLVILFPGGNWKGAHLIYEFNELKTLLSASFAQKDQTESLMALDEYPDFYAASSQRLQRLIKNKDKYDVRFFDYRTGKLEPVDDSSAAATGVLELVGAVNAAGSQDPLDTGYWITFNCPIEIADGSMLEIRIDGRAEMNRIAGFCLSTEKTVPTSNSLSIGASSRTKMLRDYHIPTYEMRKLVGSRPAAFVYATVPLHDQVIGAKLLSRDNFARLEPDLACCAELNNGNYSRTENGKFVLNLSVSHLTQAKGMQLEMAEANYLFEFGKICTRDPQVYKHIKKTWRLSEKTKTIGLDTSELKPGYRYAFRLIALDESEARTGFYSDTVCLDLRGDHKKVTP